MPTHIQIVTMNELTATGVQHKKRVLPRSKLTNVTLIIEFQAQSIKWALNKGVRQELFGEFSIHNGRLRDILGSSDNF